MNPEITSIYGNKVRVRVCGLCWRDDSLLMVNHVGLAEGDFWTPPGGGIEFGMTASDALIKEFREEVGIDVSVGAFKFACEFISHPLHAIELFFEVDHLKGEIQQGMDPEMPENSQIIKAVRWMNVDDIAKIPPRNLHGAFRLCATPRQITEISGFWRI